MRICYHVLLQTVQTCHQNLKILILKILPPMTFDSQRKFMKIYCILQLITRSVEHISSETTR